MHMQDKSHPQENFPEFKARFLADAIEGGVPESEWFYALWNKLPPRIRLQNLAMKDLWKENFSTMVQHLTRVEMERARPSNRLLPTKKVTTPTTRKSTYPVNPRTSSSTPVSQPFQLRPSSSQRQFVQTTADRNTPRPTGLALNRATAGRSSSTPAKDRAKCYRCGEYGHFKDECPNPASVNEVDGDPVEQQEENDDEDAEVLEEESEETLEGNREA